MTSEATTDVGRKDLRSVEAVMDQVGRAQTHFELMAIRFVECSARYDDILDGKEQEVRIGIADQKVVRKDDLLEVAMRFEFLAPSPVPEEQTKQVALFARIRLEYELVKDRGAVDDADATAFGRVNGIYNAWPYLREFVQTSLLRLGLPPFELPLLRAGAAAHLAGLVDPPAVDTTPAGKSAPE